MAFRYSLGIFSIGMIVFTLINSKVKQNGLILFALIKLELKKITETVIKGYVNVTLTVVGTLEYDNGKYFLNGSSFKIGDEIEITTKDYSSLGKCILISSLNDNAKSE